MMWCQAELKNKQVQEMNRFMHYYSRFKNHENSYKVRSELDRVYQQKLFHPEQSCSDVICLT